MVCMYLHCLEILEITDSDLHIDTGPIYNWIEKQKKKLHAGSNPRIVNLGIYNNCWGTGFLAQIWIFILIEWDERRAKLV